MKDGDGRREMSGEETKEEEDGEEKKKATMKEATESNYKVREWSEGEK